ncbi:PREDICTED: uncharacterized protein LOC109589631 [Amphimedon queenslandica]|uniref:Death domain-containing protein n=1 Tax=Amphimedon queenslandica TaxID=400682 RepID=A0AAN0JVZ7_AMPQE|nr:PREDICTED: uncharacterized protein LOC109589631 [Amphimedon queenslandica]|eukprot:XP_019861244.1 PREDICTED: uncharacterized protein LOC109589631 [Amphimedon queenslandica]
MSQYATDEYLLSILERRIKADQKGSKIRKKIAVGIKQIKGIFGELIKLKFDSKGLVHHCSKTGVTLIIPEGAVQQPATAWFGVCPFSTKFKFGDYIPITPIVWVYIDQKLTKPAELYLPHNINIGTTTKNLFVHLTASDQNFLEKGKFLFTCSNVKMEVDSEMFKTYCDHFCSHCVAMEKNAYQGTQKHYMIAMAEKQQDETTFVDFCCFPCQIGCKQLVMKQYKDEDFAISNLKSIMFDDEGSLSVAFDPDSVPGWERDHNGFCTGEIFESEVDYFKVMGCEPGNVNKENIEMLQMMEEVLSYPPRFRYTFSCLNSFVALDTTKVKAIFSGTSKPLQINYHLFGITVGLNEGYLRGLDKDYPTCQERFNQVFYKWSQSHPNTFKWKTVIEVLRSDTIKATSVAELVIEHLSSNE